MVVVKPIEYIKTKFKKRVEVAGPEYEHRVKTTEKSWADEAIAAEHKRNEGLKRAIETNLINLGILRRGTAFWRERTARKGAPRWRDETPKSVDTYAKEVKDFFDALLALALPPKKVKGDPANIMERVGGVVKALIAKKKEKRGVKE
ncbi:MAG: hypothetical protein QXW39_07420 [Candidatus Bathyarchaeia archaeon]